MFGSVRARLMIWNVAIVALLTVALGLAVSWRTRSELIAGVDRDLEDRATRRFGLPGRSPGQVPGPPPFGMGPGGGMFQRSPGGPPPAGMRRGSDAPPAGGGPGPGGPNRIFDPNVIFIAQGASRPRVFDRAGKSISQFTEDTPWDRAALTRADANRKPVLTDATWEGEDHRVITVYWANEPREMIAQYATPLAGPRRAIAGINQTLIAMLPLALFLAGLGGYYLTERALRPVGRIAGLAERISGENLSERLPVQGKDEFAQLAGTINGSLDRLEAAFRELTEAMEREKRFTADASHELKTPLTAIKGQTSLALSTQRGASEYREALEAVDRSASRMGELIDDLLLLARKPSGEGFAPVSVEEIAALASESVPALGARLRIQVAPETARVNGDRASLVRLLVNLLSNAARHTPANGTISLSTRRDGEAFVLEVEDTGEGIAPEHLPHLGERFYRVDSARARQDGGVGLGLAICRGIVEAHGGELRFESEMGKGTKVSVRLPAG